MSRYIVTAMYLEKPEPLPFWNGGSTFLLKSFSKTKPWISKLTSDKTRKWSIHPVPKPICVHVALVFFFPNSPVELHSL